MWPMLTLQSSHDTVLLASKRSPAEPVRCTRRLGLGLLARIAGALLELTPRLRRIGRHIRQMSKRLRRSPVEGTVHRICIELGRAARAARHRGHARSSRRLRIGQDGHSDVQERDVLGRVAALNERASSCVRAPMSRHCRAASPSAATVRFLPPTHVALNGRGRPNRRYS